MAEVVSSAAAGSTAVQPSMSKLPTAEAPAAVDAMLVSPTVPMHMSALSERALIVRTPSPLGEQARQRSQRQLASDPNSKPPIVPKRRFACCTRPSVLNEEESVGSNGESIGSLSPLPSQQHKKSHWDAFSPKKSLRAQAALTQQGSAAYSDAEWHDARSEITSLNSMTSDHAAKLEELSAMLKDMHTHPTAGSRLAITQAAPSPALNPDFKAPWIPNPPLAFGEPNMQFMPVPAVTGMAGYWLRDEDRSTPYPTPIDVMIRASTLAMKSHESIPGIWLQETDKGFSVTVKPRFMPPGLPRYTETYDKSNATEPSWAMRRDLRLGTTSGQIFMTTDGMLILRARSKPMFGHNHDFIMEEYMRTEEGGKIIVDRMCCVCIKTGARATQYVVGHHYAVPIRGHV